MSFISIVLLAALVLNTVLGLFVFLGKTKSSSTSYYFILVIFISGWIFTNYLVEFVSTQNQAWWLATTSYVSILGIAYIFLSFCYHFPEQTFRWPPVVRFITLFVTILVGALVFVPGFVIDHIIISPWKIVTGTGLGIVFAWFIILMLAAFAVLITKLKRGTLPLQEKPQLELVLSGTIVAALLGSVCNLWLPFVLQNYDYVRIGPIFTLVLVACIATAIVRYQLFNIKVISVQTFTVVLCSFLFIRTLIVTTPAEQVINGGLLSATLVTCVFLVRGALKESEQREALAVANDNQQNLIHIMNHQIKGYLGKDRMIFAELLTGEYGLIPATAKPLLTEGFEQSTRGVDYVQTILKGSSAATGMLSYNMKSMDFIEVAKSVIAEQTPVAEAKGISLVSRIESGDYRMNGDATQLGEAVRNLVENAIKYNRPHGSITVTLAREKDGTIICAVKDTGYGIAEDVKSRLFTPGGRSKDSMKYNKDSSGFGLAFVKGVIEKHGGTVGYAANTEEPGTTFFVKLPAKAEMV